MQFPPDNQSDVLVAGAGLAGLAAALVCVQNGYRVRVVEKRDAVGGNAAISAGAIWAPPTFDLIRKYVSDGNPVLQRMLVENLPHDLQWLREAGLGLSDEEPLAGFGVGRVMQGGESGSQHAFMSALADTVYAGGGEIETGVAASAAVRTADGNLAVQLTDGRTEITRALVLATGGFQGSVNLLERYVGRQRAQALRLRGLPDSVGDGLDIASSLGAETGGEMSAFYGHTMPDCELSYEELQPLTPYFARYGILLNRKGERFVDEGAALLEEINPQEGSRQPGGVYFLLFDRRIYEQHGINQNIISAVPSIDRLARLIKLGAPIYTGPSVEVLAEQLAGEGVPPAKTLSTIKTYNLACDSEAGNRLIPPRVRHAIPIVQAPFYAMRCVPGITNTCGGIRIDGKARVLDGLDRAIPCLYAAGGDAGGVFGRHYAGFLGWALASGRMAGASVTEQLRDAI
jgi:succinate dehydrogenase/fumarate reductase flavoprotein subunit